jgi:hypothetical protein
MPPKKKLPVYDPFALSTGHKISFGIGESVYLKTDRDQLEHIVVEIILCPNFLVKYELSCENATSVHYEIEISRERDVMKATGII